MIEQSGHETRDVTVGSSVQRHQLRQYLLAIGVEPDEYVTRARLESALDEPMRISFDEFGFRITASPAQWEGINQWLQRTKVD